MVVRIRLGRGAPFARRAGKNSQIARLTATLLTIVSLSSGSFGLWRLGTDLGWTGDFVFATGVLSHWQVWTAGACASQYVAWQLTRYARKAIQFAPEMESAEDARAAVPVASNV